MRDVFRSAFLAVVAFADGTSESGYSVEILDDRGQSRAGAPLSRADAMQMVSALEADRDQDTEDQDPAVVGSLPAADTGAGPSPTAESSGSAAANVAASAEDAAATPPAGLVTSSAEQSAPADAPTHEEADAAAGRTPPAVTTAGTNEDAEQDARLARLERAIAVLIAGPLEPLA